MDATILVIWPDTYDGPVMRRTLSYVFSTPPYQLIFKESLRGVRESLATTTYDVMMTLRSVETADDGIEFCRDLRRHGAQSSRAMPVIIGWIDAVGSNNTYDEAAQLCTRAGANGCFGRVFDIGGIQQMVDRLLADPTRTQLHDQPRVDRRAGHGG